MKLPSPLLAPLLLIVLGPSPLAAQFDTWTAHEAGGALGGVHPSASALGDLDGDGYPELVVVSWFQAPAIAVLPGTPDGFGSPQFLSSPAARACLLADLDGDGDLDLAVSEFGTNGERDDVAVRLNAGGAFGAPTRIAVGNGLRGLAASDLDGDGDLDLAVCVHGGNVAVQKTVAILVNDGGGGFSVSGSVPAADPSASAFDLRPWRVEAGDMDGDGGADLVVACGAQRLSVLANVTLPGGTPSFAPAVTYPVPGAVPDVDSGIALLDADQDGDLDVVYSSNSTRISPPGLTSPGAVAVLLNQGGGVLGGATLYPTTDFSVGHAVLRPADMDGDGRDDLVVVSAQGFAVLRANGAGGFLPGSWRACGEDPTDLSAADVDGDGDIDLVTTSSGSVSASIHLNAGDGVLAPPPGYRHGDILQKDIALGDVDGDGDLDVAQVGGGAGFGGSLRVSLNEGTGTYAPPTSYPMPQAGRRVQLVDLDGDGDLDLAWIDDPDSPPYNLETRLNDGNGNFGPRASWPVNTCGTWDLAMLDVDGDGDPDAVLAEALGCFGVVEKYLYVCRNDGAGAFGPPTLLAGDSTAFWGVAGGDLDGDGILDLVATTTLGLNVFLGTGAGSFGAHTLHPLPEGQRRVALADLDGDGALDVVTQQQRSTDQSAAWVLFGDGLGGLGQGTAHPTAWSRDFVGSTSLDIADVDGDGDLDVLVSGNASCDVSLLENPGDGALLPQRRFGAAGPVLDADLGDVDGDGRPDVVVLGEIGRGPDRFGFSVLSGVDVPGCDVSSFCTSGANSTGSPARIAGSGSCVAGDGSFTLTASGVPDQPFVFFFGSLPAQVPFGNGTRCAGGALTRITPPGLALGNVATRTFDPEAFGLSAGSIAHFQCWFRDPLAGGAGFDLSDGLRVVFQ